MRAEWLYFVVGAVLSWGVYVPVLHEGQGMMRGALRAFLCVGVAYFLTAVVIPIGLMYFDLAGARQGEFNNRGITFATLGGVAGAAGALCIILSIKYGGSPMYVAPLVFAGATIVSTIVSLAWKTKHMPGPLFFVGILLAAVGAGLVLYSKSSLDEELKKAKAAQAKAAAPAGTLTASAPTSH
jgi:uncharacterized membrane protein